MRSSRAANSARIPGPSSVSLHSAVSSLKCNGALSLHPKQRFCGDIAILTQFTRAKSPDCVEGAACIVVMASGAADADEGSLQGNQQKGKRQSLMRKCWVVPCELLEQVLQVWRRQQVLHSSAAATDVH